MSFRKLFLGGTLIVLALAYAVVFLTSANRTMAQDNPPSEPQFQEVTPVNNRGVDTPPIRKGTPNNKQFNSSPDLSPPTSQVQLPQPALQPIQPGLQLPQPARRPTQSNLPALRSPQQPTLQTISPAQRPQQQFQQRSTPSFTPGVTRNRLPALSNNPPSAATDIKNLVRATYKLPADAAETLTELFGHSATALVECRIEKTEDESSPLVALIVTTEPDTHHAIAHFIQVVFPADNLKEYQASAETSEKTIPATESKLISYVVELPEMTCGGCASNVRKALQESEVAFEIETDVTAMTASFQCAAGTNVPELLDRLAQKTKFFEKHSLKQR